MLVSRLLRSLLRFLSPGIVPDGGGAPAAEPTPPADTGTPDAGAAPATPDATPAEPVDRLSGLQSALDSLTADPGAAPDQTPAPGQPRDPQGRFAAASQAAAGVAATPTPPQATAAPVPAAPKPGEVDLTPPEGMNERSRQRWAQLTERVGQIPELERRATEATQALDSVRQMVSGAGLAPEEFTDMLETARLVKSANPQDAQAALQRLDAIRADLAQRFGLEAPGLDPLAAHQDLKADVDGMLMTRERALEIARLRAGNQQGQAVIQSQRELEQHQQLINQASAQMDAELQKLAGTPGHQEKLNYIGQHFKTGDNLQRFVQTYRPEQWAPTLLAMYHAYTPPTPQPTAAPVPQPLRPGFGRAGAPVRQGPVTAEGAVMGAFERLGM